MTKTAWGIMKQSHCPVFINIPSVHMIGFRSKQEAIKECDRLNKRSNSLTYFIEKAKVFQPWEP
jgi:hypothetical protein